MSAVTIACMDNGDMIVDCAIYTDGERENVDGDISDALDRHRQAGDNAFLWIGLHSPTEAEFAQVSDELGLHPLAIEDAVEAHQRPKLERYGDVSFLVLKTLTWADGTEQIETGEIMVFVGADFVITVRHGDHNQLREVRRRAEADKDFLKKGSIAVVYTVCDAVVDNYEVIAEKVQTAITELEAEVFSPQRVNLVERIYSLKREVLEFQRAVGPLVPVASGLVTGRVQVPEPVRPFFRDVADHTMRVNGRIESYSELVTSVLNAHLTQVGVRQNEDMRKISAWVAMAAIPTMIAGYFGMNFEHMPELHWSFSYPLVIVIMVGACYLVYRLFRRSGWL
jgi:magnesium transporter